MKRLSIGFLLFVVLTCIVQAQQLTVAVIPFETRGGLSKDEAEVVTELFIAELVADRTVKVVDRNSFEKIMTEMKFQQSDWADDTKVARLGKALNANSIIRGTVMALAGQTVITSTILDINTVQILSSSTLRMKSTDEVFDKIPVFVKDMMKNLPREQSAGQGGGGGKYKIGDPGPGGGTIFLIEGNNYWEVSRKLGEYNWSAAKTAAGSFRGGGFSDWYLPSMEELNYVYLNLQIAGVMNLGNDIYWSSTEGLYVSVDQRFSDGLQSSNSKNLTYSVRAVRAFNP
jgi:TolB-like protein